MGLCGGLLLLHRSQRDGGRLTGYPIAPLFGVQVQTTEVNTPKGRKIMFWMIFVGLLVGAVAKLLMPGRDPGGVVMTIVIGIAGSVIAGFLGRSIGWYRDGEPAGLIASIVGAILLLFFYRVLTGQGKSGKGGITRAA
jgi:uncharacterized membrane protein YeaQ/YmgE (transglycosylase-associated protein family)